MLAVLLIIRSAKSTIDYFWPSARGYFIVQRVVVPPTPVFSQNAGWYYTLASTQINLTQATKKQRHRLLQTGPKTEALIVFYSEISSRFKSADQLADATGTRPRTLEKLRISVRIAIP